MFINRSYALIPYAVYVRLEKAQLRVVRGSVIRITGAVVSGETLKRYYKRFVEFLNDIELNFEKFVQIGTPFISITDISFNACKDCCNDYW